MSEDLRIVHYCTRNKDNKHVEGFKQTRKVFLARTDLFGKGLLDDFQVFVDEQLPGTLSRIYVGVNPRDEDKLRKSLIHDLVDENSFDFTRPERRLVSLASKCPKGKRWIFDFDGDEAVTFVNDIKAIDPSTKPILFKTVNHWAVITEHGFDTRELLKKWGHCTEMSRDGALCLAWRYTKG